MKNKLGLSLFVILAVSFLMPTAYACGMKGMNKTKAGKQLAANGAMTQANTATSTVSVA